LDAGELEETSVGNYSGHAPTASTLRTKAANKIDAPWTDQAGLTKPKYRHEYFPSLPQPKNLSHGLPRIAAAKVPRRRETQRHESSTKMDPNLEAFREDLGALKPGVASLIEHMKSGDEQSSERRRPN
jgi:hypothetical protein